MCVYVCVCVCVCECLCLYICVCVCVCVRAMCNASLCLSLYKSVSNAKDDRALNLIDVLFKRGILHFIFKAKQNEKIVSVRFSPKTHARVRFLFSFLFFVQM